MSTKPDESKLISYLYGELDEHEALEVRLYLQQHPEELEQLNQLKEVLTTMGKLKDKEVIAPSVVSTYDTKVSSPRSFLGSGPVRTVLSIAASFLLIMVVGKLLDTKINYHEGELRISFGSKKPGAVESINQASLSPDDVQQMINSSMMMNNEMIQASWTEHQKELNKSINGNLVLNSKKIDGMMKATVQASEDQVRTFVAGLQNDNLRLMKDYLKLSSTEQQKYVEGLLVDFSKYLQEQRNQDLALFQTRMSSIEKNTNQFKQETEQILTSIITNKGVSKKTNSY
jgi:GrpB-like predicted nucleotidyltransferase (UPF0157 family)